jgi:hypothetical protein
MSQTSKKNKRSNDNTRPSPIITSPSGVKIQITAGNKLQHIRALARDPEITDAQFRALVVMVDTTNEGYGDQDNWGFSYQKYETLAVEIGKGESAAKRIVKELETGERKVGSGKLKKIVQGKVMLDAHRSGPKGGRSNVNKYWLRSWPTFAAVEDSAKGPAARPFTSGKGPVSDGKGPVSDSETVRFSDEKGPAARPDSPTPPYRHIYEDSPASANGGSGPVESFVEQDQSDAQPTPINDNQPEQDRPDAPSEGRIRKKFDEFWNAYPRKLEKDKDEAFREFRKIALSGEVKSAQIMEGLSIYRKSVSEPRYVVSPVKWLRERRWEEFAAMPRQSMRSMAI